MHGGRVLEENWFRVNRPKWVEIELKGGEVLKFACSSKTSWNSYREGYSGLIKGEEVDFRKAGQDYNQQHQQQPTWKSWLTNTPSGNSPPHQLPSMSPPSTSSIRRSFSTLGIGGSSAGRSATRYSWSCGESQRQPVFLSPHNQPRSRRYQQLGMERDHLRNQLALLIHSTSIWIINAHFQWLWVTSLGKPFLHELKSTLH